MLSDKKGVVLELKVCSNVLAIVGWFIPRRFSESERFRMLQENFR